jgi:hypothetical protein
MEKRYERWFVSSQPHEYEYFKSSIKKQCPSKSDDEVSQAILKCRDDIQPSEGRTKLESCVLKKLGKS